jgi:hypothetical protein
MDFAAHREQNWAIQRCTAPLHMVRVAECMAYSSPSSGAEKEPKSTNNALGQCFSASTQRQIYQFSVRILSSCRTAFHVRYYYSQGRFAQEYNNVPRTKRLTAVNCLACSRLFSTLGITAHLGLTGAACSIPHLFTSQVKHTSRDLSRCPREYSGWLRYLHSACPTFAPIYSAAPQS